MPWQHCNFTLTLKFRAKINCHLCYYSRIPISRTTKGNENWFEISKVASDYAKVLRYCFSRGIYAHFHRSTSILLSGGREFDSGRTNTQGLKITEENVLPL